MSSEFFNKTHCDRCGGTLGTRTISWFTDETICRTCNRKEIEIKKELKTQGNADIRSYEGCGYVPNTASIKKQSEIDALLKSLSECLIEADEEDNRDQLEHYIFRARQITGIDVDKQMYAF